MELSDEWTLMKAGLKETPKSLEWIEKELGKEAVVGIDPWVHTYAAVEAVKAKKLKLKFVDGINPVDLAMGADRPAPPCSRVYVHPMDWAGEDTAAKLTKIRKDFTKEDKTADVLLVSMLDQVAWALNLRGSDIEFNPVFLAYLAVLQDSAVLYTDAAKLADPAVLAQLEAAGVTVKGYEEVEEDVKAWAAEGKALWVDQKTMNYKLASLVAEAAEAAKTEKATEGEEAESSKPTP